MFKIETSLAVFIGSVEEDITKLFSFFENVTMKGKTGEEEESELLSYIDGVAFKFYFETF